MSEFKKNCPKCGREQVYSCKKSLHNSLKNNSLCKKCATKDSAKLIDRSFQKTDEYRQKMSLACSGNVLKDETRKKLSCASTNQWKEKRDIMMEVITSETYRMKQSKSGKIKWSNEIFKKKMEEIHKSDEYREKRRKIKLNTLKTRFGGKLANYNKTACMFIDMLNDKYGLHFKHALNSGEEQICGFLVDGYDEIKNIVFEYDESHHYNVDGNLKDDDIRRQNIIITKQKPVEFWRYNEKKNELYDVISGRRVL